ncbi:MAG: methionine--tRNA ligase, partial [Patescibacteria group bacterium]
NLWEKIAENGDLEKRKYQGLYCVGCEEFKTKKVLIDGNKCPIHLKEVEIVEEENWFFKLSKYSQALKEKINSGELNIVPESRKNEILSLLNEGLEDISFSRPKEKLSWGIPVPGDESQIIYVWCDALTNYITGIGYGSNSNELFDKFWPADIHLIGKDILRFHAAIWPAMLLSAKLPTPKTIMTHGFITSNGHKMSKSLGNVISPFELIEKYNAEAVRYYLLKEIPTLDDGDLTEEKLKERYNSDLANGLGNFAARVLTMATKIDLKDFQPKEEIILKIKEIESAVNKKIEEFKLNEALTAIWELIGYGDLIVNNEKPWENPENKKDVLTGLVLILKKSAELLLPFLPQTTDKILTSIQNNQKGENLFPRLK